MVAFTVSRCSTVRLPKFLHFYLITHFMGFQVHWYCFHFYLFSRLNFDSIFVDCHYCLISFVHCAHLFIVPFDSIVLIYLSLILENDKKTLLPCCSFCPIYLLVPLIFPLAVTMVVHFKTSFMLILPLFVPIKKIHLITLRHLSLSSNHLLQMLSNLNHWHLTLMGH